MSASITEVFGIINAEGNVDILYIEDGMPVTRLDANIYPIDSSLSAKHEHSEGITISLGDAKAIGITLE